MNIQHSQAKQHAAQFTKRKEHAIMEMRVKAMFFWDYTFFLLIPPLLLALYARQKVKNTYKHYSQQLSSSRISGAQVAKKILQSSGAGNVTVEKTRGQLSDHYDPRKRVLRLSEGVHDSSSLAALGIAAHETGHAL